MFAYASGVAAAASAPRVTTSPAAGTGQTTAVLHGDVDANGSSTTYYFQWGLTTGYGDQGLGTVAGSANKQVSVSQRANQLEPGTIYHYRLVATNEAGTSLGADRTFKTTGPSPTGATTGPTTNLGTKSAALTGTVNPAGATTTYYFQWGTSTSYTHQTTSISVAGGNTSHSVTASLQGQLVPGTIYHYRIVATRPGGVPSYGTDARFMTYPSHRPRPRVTATTSPRHPTRLPTVLTTRGRIKPPASIPALFACRGNVTIRLFFKNQEVRFTQAPVQPNCRFIGRTAIPSPPRRIVAVHVLVVIRFVSTPYLAASRPSYEHITLG
jgi:hypothetical protein